MRTNKSRPIPGRHAVRTSSREAGSAYVLTLLALLILTLLGLALALITQSEAEVGANERTINRVFYGAEAGITATVANYLFNNSRQANEFTYLDPVPSVMGTRVSVEPMLQINSGPCNLCEINQNTDFYNITHQLQAQAVRFGEDGDGNEVVLARKDIELMVAIQPIQESLDLENFDPSRP